MQREGIIVAALHEYSFRPLPSSRVFHHSHWEGETGQAVVGKGLVFIAYLDTSALFPNGQILEHQRICFTDGHQQFFLINIYIRPCSSCLRPYRTDFSKFSQVIWDTFSSWVILTSIMTHSTRVPTMPQPSLEATIFSNLGYPLLFISATPISQSLNQASNMRTPNLIGSHFYQRPLRFLD